MAEQGAEELEKEITCAVCHEHYTEPKVLPCCHYYCKQCILRLVQRTGVDKPFSCPECRKEATLPQGDVDQLQTAFFVNRMKEVHSKFERAHGKVEAKCEMCSGGKAEAFCRQCTMFICSECVKQHQKLKVFTGHKASSLDELRVGAAKEILMQKSSLQSCKKHEEPMKIFCFDCNSLICRDCIIKDHSGHNYDFINVTAPDVKKKLIEQLDPLKELKQSLSQAVKEVRDTKSKIEAQGYSVSEEIESSFEELVKILEKHKQELLKEAAMEVTHKLECLCVQEKSLSTSCAVIESVIEYTEQCVEHSADDEVMCMHAELESRITREIKEQCKEGRTLEPVEEADMGVEVSCSKELERICQNKAKVIELVDLTKCIVTGEGAKNAETRKNATFSVKTNLKNERLAKQKCFIGCRLKSIITGSIVQCKVSKTKAGEYRIRYTPTVHGDHELTVTVNEEAVPGSPFSVCVSIHPAQLGKPVKTLSGLDSPFDVAVNSEGGIIVTERYGMDVVMFDREGRRLRNIKCSDNNIRKPGGVAVDKEDNIYFIDNQDTYVIYKTNKQMEIISRKDSKYKSSDDFGYVAVIGDEVMLSASNSHTTIEVYNTDLQYVREITPHNIGSKTLDLTGISSDEHGTLYVSDYRNMCIQVLSNDGEFLFSIAHTKLSDPLGLCVAGQYVYVTEQETHMISVYTREGEYVTSFGQCGSKEGDFDHPRGICVDRHGLVYVCDSYNNRVKIL